MTSIIATPPSPNDIYDDGDYRKIGFGVKRTNALLVRKPTGVVKPTTFNLPGESFTYGRRDQFDDEGVREVVGSWRYHNAAALPPPGRDFVKLNAVAIANGAIDSKSISSFRSTHDIRLRNSGASQTSTTTGTRRNRSSLPPNLPNNITFGLPSLGNTPINDVICNTYQRQWIEEQRALQAKRESQELKKQMNKQKGSSMHTRASLGHMKVAVAPPGPVFKMAKFANIPSRITLPRGNASDQNSYNYHSDEIVSPTNSTVSNNLVSGPSSSSSGSGDPLPLSSTGPSGNQSEKLIVHQTPPGPGTEQ